MDMFRKRTASAADMASPAESSAPDMPGSVPVKQKSDDTIIGHPTTLGERRSENEILQLKLPKFLRGMKSMHVTDPQLLESEAYTNALLTRLEIKNVAIATVAEFFGTFGFLFFGEAIVTRVMDTGNGGTPSLQAQLYASLGIAFSLWISVWVFYRISGGVQNPAITLALTLAGALTWTKFVTLTIAQFIGGIAGAALVSAILPGVNNSRTTLGADVSVVQGFWIEFFLTSQLTFTVLMLAVEKHKGTFLAPAGIGLSLFVIQLFGISYTGASVNPARSLGPDVATHTFNGYCWIYYAAPYAGALFSTAFYGFLKWLRYETTSPDQDADEHASGMVRHVLFDTDGKVMGTLGMVSTADYKSDEEKKKLMEDTEHGDVTTEFPVNGSSTHLAPPVRPMQVNSQQ